MKKNNIVINTLVFSDGLKNGAKQSEMLKTIHYLGINNVEVRREFIKDFDVELQEIKAVSEKFKMTLYYSVPNYLYVNGEFCSDIIEGYFIEANKMNCKNVKLNIGEYNDITAENANRINSLCDKYSIKLTIENDQTEDNGKVNKIKAFLEKAKSLGMKIGCTYDIGNWLWQNEDPVENANILKPYVTYIHLKDVVVKDKPQAAFLNNGIIPWKSILKIFDEDVPVAIEYPCSPYTLARLNTEINKLSTAN